MSKRRHEYEVPSWGDLRKRAWRLRFAMWRRFRVRAYAGIAALGASAAAALTAALPLLSAYLAIGMGLAAVAAAMLNMAYTNATLSAKIDNQQKSLAGLAAQYKTDVTLGVLLDLGPLISAGSSQASFLASITQMAHLPNDNSTGSTWVTGERDFYNNFKAEAVSSNLMA